MNYVFFFLNPSYHTTHTTKAERRAVEQLAGAKTAARAFNELALGPPNRENTNTSLK